MTSVQEMIDRWGTPPAELCLDWAWQLQAYQDRFERTPSVSHPQSAEPALAEPALDWTHVLISPSGQLQLSEADAAQTLTHFDLAPLVEQLCEWASSAPVPSSADAPARETAMALSPLSLRQRLSQQTLQYSEIATQTQRSPDASQPVLRQPSTSAAQRTHNRYRFQPRYAMAIAALAGILLLLAYWPSVQHQRAEIKAPASQAPASQAPVRLAPASLPDDLSLASEDLSLLEPPSTESENGLEALDSLSDSAFQSPLERIRGSSQLAETTTRPAQAASASSTTASEDQVPMASAPSSEERQRQRLPSGTVDGSDLVESDLVKTDLVADIAEVTKRAEVQSAESVVVGEQQPGKPTSNRALVIPTTPALQLQKFDRALRPRQPSWRLRLTVTDGLTVSPDSSQTVVGRDVVHWRISDSSDSQPDGKTHVLVQAQLASIRDASLRWRIAAAAEDLGGVVLPLDQKLLDQVQGLLGNRTRLAQAEVERLRTLGRVDGLPAETRSALTQQRKWVESQLKLGTRLLEVVADANQFSGWLDGQLQIHAQLSDAATTPPTVLQTFGSPDSATHP